MIESPDVTQALAAALRKRLALIADRAFYQRDPTSQQAELQAVSEKITALAAHLPPPVDPQLAHYFQRGSFDKALAFLEANSVA